MEKPFSIKLLNLIFKIISFFLPVKKRVLFLGSPRNRTLMENGQMVYDVLTCDKKVIVKEMPHNVWDIIYISFFIMTSKVIVLDDHYRYLVYIPLKDNQKLVQMYHGPGAFKKVALDLPNHSPIEKFYHEQYDAFICTSPDISIHMETGFGLNPEKIKALGYPRSDLLFNNKEELEKEFFSEFPELKGKNIIVYLPTYRRYGENLLDFDYEIDWQVFDEFLGETNSVCLVKRHPLQITHDLEIVPNGCKNIIDVIEFSYFPMIVASNVLITDFSSVFFDYLLLDKPIIFYCPDSEEYLEKNGIYLKFPDDLPGDYCQTFDELLNSLTNVNEAIDYSEFKKRYMSACDGKSTQKVSKLIEDYLNN